jgi:hypothetical protein
VRSSSALFELRTQWNLQPAVAGCDGRSSNTGEPRSPVFDVCGGGGDSVDGGEAPQRTTVHAYEFPGADKARRIDKRLDRFDTLDRAISLEPAPLHRRVPHGDCP